MLWRRVLIVAASLAALLLSVHSLCLRYGPLALLADLSYFDSGPQQPSFFHDVFLEKFSPQDIGTSERSYPFVWQRAKRKQLGTLLERPATPPTGTDEVALARFVQYAERNGNESIYREGMRREPNNALYHYLLADLYINQGISGSGPITDKKTGAFHYDYTITNRQKLDLGMHELATGLQMPLQSHRGALLRARMNAMPPTRDLADRLNQIAILAAALFPEFAKVRNFERVNGFYLSTLLSEAKRAEAEPFLHTGERLVVQLSNDTPPTLISQLVALAIGTISEQRDAQVCRSFGLTREAATIEAHQKILIGKLREWKERKRTQHANQNAAFIRAHAGVLPQLLLPVYGAQPNGVITEASLRPSRLVEYVIIERVIVTGLCIVSFLLLVFAGLKYWQWKLATRGSGKAAPDIELSHADWVRILGYGLLLPLTLYLLYIAVPAISWRDRAFIDAGRRFYFGLEVFALWTLIMPTTMAAGILLRRSIATGQITVSHPWSMRGLRLMGTVASVAWSCAAFWFILLPFIWAILTPILDHSIFSGTAQVVMMCVGAILLLALPLLPAIWTRRWACKAPFHLAMSRSMMTVYAAMTIFFAALALTGLTFERHYVVTDQLMSPMYLEKNDIVFNKVEGDLVLMLRQGVRDGATQLGIPWR